MRFPVFARWMLLIAAALLFVRKDVVVSDTWWALRAGRDMWASHHVLLRETYSYTARGAFWPNHEWLWEVLAYRLYAIGGLVALSLVNTALAWASLALARAPHPTTKTAAFLLAPAGLLVLSEVTVRPQVSSLLCLSLTVWLLARERYWPVVPLILLWANLHGGVTLGISVLGCAVLVALWRALTHHELRRLWVVVLTAVGGIGATLATPLGIGLWSYVPASVARSKGNAINEWRSALHFSPETDLFWASATALLVLAVVQRRRLTGWTAQLLMLATVVMFAEAVVAVRNIACWALVALPFATCLLRGSPEPARAEDRSIVPHARRWLVVFGVATAAITAALYAAPPDELGWTPISPGARQAVTACPSRVYNTYDIGGELIWWIPRSPVFVDNRQDPYPEPILDLGLLGSPGRSRDYRATFARLGVTCAVFTKDDGVVRSVLRPAGWSTAYRDARWMVMTAPQEHSHALRVAR